MVSTILKQGKEWVEGAYKPGYVIGYGDTMGFCEYVADQVKEVFAEKSQLEQDKLDTFLMDIRSKLEGNKSGHFNLKSEGFFTSKVSALSNFFQGKLTNQCNRYEIIKEMIITHNNRLPKVENNKNLSI